MATSIDARVIPTLDLPTGKRNGGWCVWCGEVTEGANQTWHPECGREYQSLAEREILVAAVIARDGELCAMCGRTGWAGRRPKGAQQAAQLELDHRVPLWAVASLPIASRRAFFAPANLWLLCLRHHRIKTAAEAAARAEMNRRLAAKAKSGLRPPQPSVLPGSATPRTARVPNGATRKVRMARPQTLADLRQPQRDRLLAVIEAGQAGLVEYEYDGPLHDLKRRKLVFSIGHPTRRDQNIWTATIAAYQLAGTALPSMLAAPRGDA